MKHHPYSEIWPLMSGKDFEEFKADIVANGLRTPVVIYQGQILDGRNRERACNEAGIPACYEQAKVATDAEALDLVVSLNMHRRHLSLAQRAFAAAKLANIKNGSNQFIKRVEGIAGAIPCSGTTTRRQAAAKIGVSFGSVQRAAAVLSKGTEADEQEVLDGKTTLTRKAEILIRRTPRVYKPSQPSRSRARSGGRVLRLHNAPPLKSLTREQVDPEFKGSPMEWVDKYGHVQLMTAEQYAAQRFDDWVSNARALAKRWRELPELRDVDHNWLRSPSQRSITILTESLTFLRPKIAELEALLARAIASRKKSVA